MAATDEELDFDEIDMFSNLSQISTPLEYVDEFKQLFELVQNIQSSPKGKEFFEVIYYMLPPSAKFKLVDLSKFSK